MPFVPDSGITKRIFLQVRQYAYLQYLTELEDKPTVYQESHATYTREIINSLESVNKLLDNQHNIESEKTLPLDFYKSLYSAVSKPKTAPVIDAKLVIELRDKFSTNSMAAKKALVKANGDVEEAANILRTMGW